MISVLVTGAAGFIGRRVVATADRSAYRVQATSRRGATNGGVPALALDLSGPLDALPQVDWVFHLAGGYVGGSARQLERSDLDVATRLIAWGREAGVRNWVFASAAEVYGACVGPATEDAPARPLIPYGRVKLEIERRFGDLSRDLPGGRIVILRIGEVYGRNGTLIDELSRRFSSGFCPWFGHGEVQVSFVHVDDVAGAFWAAARNAPPGLSTWNVADSAPVTWRTFLDYAAARRGAKPAVGLPLWLSRCYAGGSGVLDRVRGRSPTLTQHIVTLLTTPKPMSSHRACEQLGVRLRYPDYRAGLDEALRPPT